MGGSHTAIAERFLLVVDEASLILAAPWGLAWSCDPTEVGEDWAICRKATMFGSGANPRSRRALPWAEQEFI